MKTASILALSLLTTLAACADRGYEKVGKTAYFQNGRSVIHVEYEASEASKNLNILRLTHKALTADFERVGFSPVAGDPIEPLNGRQPSAALRCKMVVRLWNSDGLVSHSAECRMNGTAYSVGGESANVTGLIGLMHAAVEKS